MIQCLVIHYNILSKKSDFTLEKYREAVSMSHQGETVVLKRSPKEKNINSYNPAILRAWQANIDVQFCLNPYGCIHYMISYVTKDEREMGQVLKAVSNEMCSSDIRHQMKKCASAFMNSREVSAQEAVYRLRYSVCHFLKVILKQYTYQLKCRKRA